MASLLHLPTHQDSRLQRFCSFYPRIEGLDSRSLRDIESISWHYRASGSVHNNFPHLVLQPNVASAGLAMSSDSPKTTQSKPSTNLIQQSLAGRDLVADLVPGGWQRRVASMKRAEAFASVEISCFFLPMYSVDLVASSHDKNKKRLMNLLEHILRFKFHENAMLQF